MGLRDFRLEQALGDHHPPVQYSRAGKGVLTTAGYATPMSNSCNAVKSYVRVTTDKAFPSAAFYLTCFASSAAIVTKDIKR